VKLIFGSAPFFFFFYFVAAAAVVIEVGKISQGCYNTVSK